MTAEPAGIFPSYADLAVKVGLNLQPGQRLLVIGPLANGGVSLEAAPLVREIAASAYRAGAVQQTMARSVRPFREQISRNQTHWGVIAAASRGWAARVFADAPPAD